MKNLLTITIIFSLLISSCCSTFPTTSHSTTEELEEIELQMLGNTKTPVKTIHEGTIQDPISVGQYTTWGIYNENRFFNERNDYEITMNVNYTIRGEQAIDLYNHYKSTISPSKNNYNSNTEVENIIAQDYELAIINITIGVESNDNSPLRLNPTDFNIATKSGIKIPSGKYNSDYLKYHNLIDFELYPGGKATGNLVFSVPKNKEILLEYVSTWFEIE